MSSNGLEKKTSQANLKNQRSGSMAPAAKKKPAAAPKGKATAKPTDQPKKINAKKAAKPAAKPQPEKKELGSVKGGTYKTETTLK